MFEKNSVDSLNDLETKVYSYILLHYEKVIYMTIRELSVSCHVSTTAILNFCYKMNCEGYTDFRTKLRIYLEKESERKDNKEVSDIIGFFSLIKYEGFHHSIERAVSLISKKKQVIFIGTGSSGIIARYGARVFNSQGKFGLHIDDPWNPIVPNDYSDSVAIILSVSGETPDLMNICRKLKKFECSMISISSHPNCTISSLSDIHISYHLPLKLIDNDFNVTTQIPAVYILELLGRGI